MYLPSLLSAAIATLLTFGGNAVIASPLPDSSQQKLEQTLRFPVKEAVLQYARKGEEYHAQIGGLALGTDGGPITFEKTEGQDWIQVDKEGKISGTPGPDSPEVSYAWVQAQAEDSSTTDMQVAIPVREADSKLLQSLNVMTYNLWEGGVNVDNYHEKQLLFLLESRADVVGLQEAGGDHVTRLANGLGWYYTKYDHPDLVGIISRYPIVEEYKPTTKGIGARISLGDGPESEINLWSTHLSAYPYGPHEICLHGQDPQVVLDEVEKVRAGELSETLNAVDPQIDDSDNIPFILVGDFNAPSHTDWVEENAKYHCGVKNADWPTSILPNDRGLTDSYRSIHPVSDFGTTWSPIVKNNEEGKVGEDGKILPEPQDRIDFIYHVGKVLQVQDSITTHGSGLGRLKEKPDHAHNYWTSDHNAVMTTYSLEH